jgi:alpha-1,6-mannosyltransferase
MTASRKLALGLSLSAASLLIMTAAGAYALASGAHERVEWIMLAQAPIYAGAAWLLLRHQGELSHEARRRAVYGILTVAAIARAMLLFEPPVSTDIYRYIWDGRVQAAGVNPYDHRPADPQLAPLRDEMIYPQVNHADYAITIYPPMAQVVFLLSTRIAENVTIMKASMVAFEAVAFAAIFALLARHNLPQTRILLYAWHPLPLFEFAGSGHVDAMAIGLMLLACIMADRRHPAIAGALLAGATLVKYFPALLAPVLYRRWDWRFPTAAILAGALLYLPYISVGHQVLGFLPGYVEEEHLTQGSGFFAVALLDKLSPLPSVTPLAYVVLAGNVLALLGLVAIFQPVSPKISLAAAMVMITSFTVLLSPHFPWYFTWIVPFLCFRPSPALIYLTGSAALLYGNIWTIDRFSLSAAMYGPFVIILSIEIFLRRGMYGGLLLSEGGRVDQRSAT